MKKAGLDIVSGPVFFCFTLLQLASEVPMPPNGDTWDMWRIHVLKELERLNKSDGEQGKILTTIVAEIAALKTKAGVWGAVGAAIPVCVFLVMEFLRNRGGA